MYIYKDNQVKYFTPNGYFKDHIPYNNSEDLGFNTYKYNGYTFRELKFNISGYTIQIIRNIDSEMGLLNKLLIIFCRSNICNDYYIFYSTISNKKL